MPKARIRNRVRELREAAELTQAGMAKQCGCTRQTVIMLEQGRYVPSLSLAFAIARTFGRRVDEIFEPVDEDA